jgi:hypothetical protein
MNSKHNEKITDWSEFSLKKLDDLIVIPESSRLEPMP